MNEEELFQKIESCNSKQQALFLAGHIAKNKPLIELIFALMEDPKHKKAWKAAWVLDHIYQDNPNLINTYVNKMINLFMLSDNDSTRRILGKLLSFYDITEKVDGNFVNTCFDLLQHESVAVAVKVHAMQLLFNISQTYPELRAELKLIIEEQTNNNTIAFKARAKRLLRKL
ncbi:hypothetical protein [Saccharicrinis carchari]|nr:hypothetical protein [Saccharicrinis carchari]